MCIRDRVGHGGTLRADGNVNAEHALALLVDDGIGRDGGLAGLAVAADQLTLAAADGDHGVDGLDAGLQGLLNRLAVDDAGSAALNGAVLGLSLIHIYAVCAACGKACKVPFQPREDRPVYCSDCFARMKQN